MRWSDLPRVVVKEVTPARIARRIEVARATPGVSTLRARSRWMHTPVTGKAPVVVSMTSYGSRIDTVHLALESIAGGRERPRRLILWLDDESIVADPPAPLARLRRRGLEILPTPDWGPHKKYFPYVTSLEAHRLPLVTADDDVLYGYRWLHLLMQMHAAHPRDVVAHRAHRIVLAGGRIAPYARWERVAPDEAGPLTFATGVSGVLYPPVMLDALRDAGTAFLECAPRADDVWLHAMAVRTGTTVRPVSDGLTTYRDVPRAGLGGLAATNIVKGGNDAQIAATYTDADLAVLHRAERDRLYRDATSTSTPTPTSVLSRAGRRRSV